MRLNRTSVWKVRTIGISRELSLFNLERLDILCALIGQRCEKLWPLEILESFRCTLLSVSIYYVPDRTSMWKVMTIGISRELSLFNFERLDILCALIGHPSEKLWPFQFLERFRCSIWSVLKYYASESNIRVKCYEDLSFSRASVFQFWTTRYVMSLNQTSEWKVMIIGISREFPLFNFQRLNILYALIGNLSEKFWPFEFLKSFRCSITSVSIWDAPKSDLRVKS